MTPVSRLSSSSPTRDCCWCRRKRTGRRPRATCRWRAPAWRCCRICRSAPWPPPLAAASRQAPRRGHSGDATAGGVARRAVHEHGSNPDGRQSLIRQALSIIVCAAATASLACGSGAEAPTEGPAAMQVGQENVVRVSRERIVAGPLISGRVRAREEATVRAEIGGPVLQVTVEEGQAVRRGTLLGRIEGKALQDAQRSATSAVRSGENQLALAQARSRTDRATGEGRRAGGPRPRSGARRRHPGRRATGRRQVAARRRREAVRRRGAARAARRRRLGPGRQRRRRGQPGHGDVHDHRSVVDAARSLGPVRRTVRAQGRRPRAVPRARQRPAVRRHHRADQPGDRPGDRSGADLCLDSECRWPAGRRPLRRRAGRHRIGRRPGGAVERGQQLGRRAVGVARGERQDREGRRRRSACAIHGPSEWRF